MPLQAAPNAASNAPAGSSKPKSTAPAAQKADDVIAKGKGVQVKRSELQDAMDSVQKGMSAQGREIPREQIEAIQPQILERLITMDLLTSRATAEDKKKAKELSEERVAELTTRAGSQEAVDRQLKMVGLSMEEFKTKLQEETLAETVLERELNPEVTDAEVKKFYEENPARFEQPEMVRASHILLMTKDEAGNDLSAEKKEEKRKKIEELLKKARAGEDFAKLAKEHSEDPGSKDKGGEYTFPRGQMVPEFEKAAFSLKTNEVSDVVTTQYGYHIIKLHEKLPAKKVAFEEVAPKIKEALKAQEMQQGMTALMEKLRKEADVQITDPSLKPQASLTNAPATAQPPAAGTEKKK